MKPRIFLTLIFLVSLFSLGGTDSDFEAWVKRRRVAMEGRLGMNVVQTDVIIHPVEFSNESEVARLAEELVAFRAQVEGVHQAITRAVDEAWLIISGIGIFTMQLGFGILEAGTTEAKSVKAVLIKNLGDTLLGGITWYMFGYGLSSGDNVFAGGDSIAFLLKEESYFAEFFHSYGFAATSSTIVSGAIIGRIRLESYLTFSSIFTAFAYPLAAHWTWGTKGFLHEFGFVDFAGGMTVHGIGGVAALIGALVVGPRIGRFYELGNKVKTKLPRPLKSSSSVLTTLGGFLLYINWFFFNGGSSLALITNNAYQAASKAIVNTLVASIFSGGSIVLYVVFWSATKEIETVINGVLSGLVAITAGCAHVSAYDSAFIGMISAVIYMTSSYLMLYRANIDDALDAFVVHGVCGAFGTIAIGFFAENGGIFHDGDAKLLVAQVKGVLFLTVWSAVNALLIFGVVKLFLGLRVSNEEQLVGLDMIHHETVINEMDSVDVQSFALTRDTQNRLIQRSKQKKELYEKKHSSNPKTQLRND